jgi:molybdate transport system substrate-binding protein
MTTRSVIAAASTGVISLLVGYTVGQAADLIVLSAIAMQTVMEDLGPKFERASGHKLAIAFGTMGQVVRRLQDGEAADVIIIPRPGIDDFIKSGKIEAGNVTDVAYSIMGVAVRRGAPKPDISTSEAFKHALLAAQSFTYPNPATGAAVGGYIVKLLDQLGITHEMKPKTILLTKAGLTPNLVANGEAEITVNHVQELVPIAGIEIVGPLPDELQNRFVFSAAIVAGSKQTEASKALVDFLRTPQAAAVIKEKGMEPGAQ